MKILLLGDASNYHHALGIGLSTLGHDVTVASDGSRWMDTARNIDLSRRAGKLGGALLWMRLNTVLAGRLKGYDVVQIVSPIFVGLRPGRVASLFRKLKRDNGAVFLTALGTDAAFVEMCLAADNPLRYSEWSVAGHPTPFAGSEYGRFVRQWIAEPLLSHCRAVYDNVDGVVTALYEYHLAMQRYVEPSRLTYAGIPVDTRSIEFREPTPHDGPLRVLAPYHTGREAEKGTDILRDIAASVPNIDLQSVTGLRFDEFRRRLADCDIVLDQYYSYTPATTALMAMAAGKTVVTGVEPEYEEFIGDKVPAINVDPFNHDSLRDFLAGANDPEALRARGRAARDFVERHHAAPVVAVRFLEAWQR